MFYRSLFMAMVTTLSLGGSISVASAQTDPNQLEQLGNIQDRQDARRVALQQAQVEAQRQAAAKVTAQQRAAVQARARASARAQAVREAEIAQRNREREDDRSYLDANRSLDLQERQLKLRLAQAQANHAEDYVKQELDQQKTNTDIARSIAQDDQKMKDSIGQAVRMSQRHWWEK